jgi:hypothetical protein
MTDTSKGKEALDGGGECQRLCMQGHSEQWETAKTCHETPGLCVTDKAKEGNGNCFNQILERDDTDL